MQKKQLQSFAKGSKLSYTVNLSPPAKEELWHYIEGGLEFGDDIPETILDAFGNCVSILQDSPKSGSGNLPYLLPKYRALQLWKHYWLIYQVIEKQSLVNIEYVVDDRHHYPYTTRQTIAEKLS